MPQWVRANTDAFDTGSKILDEFLLVLLETSMFVAGLIGFILDNTIPGNVISHYCSQQMSSLNISFDFEKVQSKNAAWWHGRQNFHRLTPRTMLAAVDMIFPL